MVLLGFCVGNVKLRCLHVYIISKLVGSYIPHKLPKGSMKGAYDKWLSCLHTHVHHYIILAFMPSPTQKLCKGKSVSLESHLKLGKSYSQDVMSSSSSH